jgi:hypothetical protein
LSEFLSAAPHEASKTVSDWQELLERFRRGPELVAAALTGAAGPEVDFRPEGRWSIRQIAAHLADSEIVLAERLRRVLAEDNPLLTAFDQNAWAERLDYARRKPSQSLETFRRIRQENYELIQDLTPEALQRRARHSERGEITVLDLVRGGAEHAERHSLQIRDVRSAYRNWKAQQA